ncbi:hypothetical protein BD779DRAFT_1549817 [Infundibulicybe gibba]|nr:hypothetical protein BD779DRAFT_1549817 [Infundibulicybe gibba]
MSSDGRYMYHAQGMSANYDYAPYPPHPLPPSSYDNPQMSQPPLRPMRSNPPSQPHSPPQQSQYNHPPPTYPPGYAPGPYIAQAPPPQQWPSEGWAHYNQSYAPPPPPAPPAEQPYNSGPGRAEPASTSSDPRAYATPSTIITEAPRRVEERPPQNTQAQPKLRRREKEPSPPATSPGTPTGLDFMKLLESYRLIIDASESLSQNGRPPPIAETVERMLQNVGVCNVATTIAALNTRSPKENEPEDVKEPTGDGAASTKRQKADDNVQEGQTCLGCNATSTPEWRRGPMGTLFLAFISCQVGY